MPLKLSLFFLLSILPHPVLPLPQAFPSTPKFMSMGHTYKVSGFYISYTIPTLPLSIFYLPFMPLNLCTFPPSLPFPLPYW